MVILHPLHESLDLARKFPEEERKSVLLRNSAWSFPPKGPELKVSMALFLLHELAETPRLKDKELLACSAVITTNNTLKSQLCVCSTAIIKGTATYICGSWTFF